VSNSVLEITGPTVIVGNFTLSKGGVLELSSGANLTIIGCTILDGDLKINLLYNPSQGKHIIEAIAWNESCSVANPNSVEVRGLTKGCYTGSLETETIQLLVYFDTDHPCTTGVPWIVVVIVVVAAIVIVATIIIVITKNPYLKSKVMPFIFKDEL